MLKFAADENFNNDVLRGVLRLNPNVDIVRIQDAELRGVYDPAVLAWAAEQNRVLLTHDVKTMTKYAYERVTAGLSMPGVFEVSLDMPLGEIIEEIIILAECSLENEWEGQVRYLPIR